MLTEGTANRMSSVARTNIEPAEEVAPRPKRRLYFRAEKRHMVEESFQPQTSMARVARQHGINGNQPFIWRFYRCGQPDII